MMRKPRRVDSYWRRRSSGRPFDRRDRNVRRRLPFANPLRLERSGHHEQAPRDTPGVEERMTSGDGLCGLAEPHVVGQKKPLFLQEAAQALALVRVQGAFERPKMGNDLVARGASGQPPVETLSLFVQQGDRRGLGAQPRGTTRCGRR